MPDYHVVPLNDLVQHLQLRQCLCHPAVEEFPNGNAVVVHHAADAREYFEATNTVKETPRA